MKINSAKSTKTINQQRQEMINFFYHHFVMNYSLKQTQKFFVDKKKFTLYQQETIIFIFTHFNAIIDLISKHLSDQWSFSEIAHLEKAILIVAIGEFFEQKVTKNIVINEAVRKVQTFSNFTAYSYINKVLDIIFSQTPSNFFDPKNDINKN